MKKNKNLKKETAVVKSAEQAKTALNMLLQNPKKNLESGISELLEKLKNPKLDLLLDRYPDLLQEYDLEELLTGDLEVIDAEVQDVKTAGLLSCLQLLIHFCYELKENTNPKDNNFDSLRYILRSITCYEFVHELLLLVIAITGTDYYQKFQQRIQNLDFEQVQALQNDLDLQEHIEMMAWFGLVRLFLESVYTYFNSPDQNFKNTT
ncbi:hypothetical protein GKZ90_0013925 [Flavobacterium sp. MC2016-06]|jgi:hypothetical protein|uniref:hypothetical protein n=1 Tax=Flavobacterium sp. MC2016-06 TaxID=2676308 RepID=UPI0012BA7FBB|nr:hypothetical protein [Flavobacterium sp. MC2016-06]MBU3861734.1 hypothetical protein [Flavobacterium sp. MC2016-06]